MARSLIAGLILVGVAESASSELPAAAWRYPFNNPYIVHAAKSSDNLPDYSLNGLNNAESCPTDWQEACTCHDHANQVCKMGTPATLSTSNCTSEGRMECKGFLNSLPGHARYGSCHSTTYEWSVMTRAQILERALGWVAFGFSYGTRAPYVCKHSSCTHGAPETCASDDDAACPQWQFGSSTKKGDYYHSAVCNDLPAMAWKSPCMASKGIKISCDDLLPGDVYSPPNHYMLFRRWIDQAAKQMLVYQMGWGAGKTNAMIVPLKDGHCYRRPNIKEVANQPPTSVVSPTPRPAPFVKAPAGWDCREDKNIIYDAGNGNTKWGTQRWRKDNSSNMEDCLQYCADLQTCQGFDYNLVHRQCYVKLSSTISHDTWQANLNNQPGWSACWYTGGPSPTPAPTPAPTPVPTPAPTPTPTPAPTGWDCREGKNINFGTNRHLAQGDGSIEACTAACVGSCGGVVMGSDNHRCNGKTGSIDYDTWLNKLEDNAHYVSCHLIPSIVV